MTINVTLKNLTHYTNIILIRALKAKCVQVSLAEVSVRTSDIHIEVALQGRGVYNFFFLETFFVLNILLERYLVYTFAGAQDVGRVC